VVYINSKSFVSTHDGDTEAFTVNSGILQGDTLAPFLFIIVLDYVLRPAICNSELGVTLQPKLGSRYPAECLTDLDFADDIVLVSENITNGQTLLQKLETAVTTDNVIITDNVIRTDNVITVSPIV